MSWLGKDFSGGLMRGSFQPSNPAGLWYAIAVAVVLARQSLGKFARAVLPVQAMAISTQSSLASLPAMLAACRTLGLRDTTGEFVLPLAVALFRATGPAMNLAVAIYVAKLAGMELTPPMLATGVVVALATTIGSVSLPGAISFVNEHMNSVRSGASE